MTNNTYKSKASQDTKATSNTMSSKATPGPGHYSSVDNIFRKAPAFRIGNSLRKPLVKDSKIPGPG